jgi:hypothetical protein
MKGEKMEDESWGIESESPTPGMGRRERCVPDYEKLIKEVNERLLITQNFFEAVKAALLGPHLGFNRNKLKSLLGWLYIKAVELKREQEKLVLEAEKEQKP